MNVIHGDNVLMAKTATIDSDGSIFQHVIFIHNHGDDIFDGDEFLDSD